MMLGLQLAYCTGFLVISLLPAIVVGSPWCDKGFSYSLGGPHPSPATSQPPDGGGGRKGE